ncbi:Beta-eliminating lyase [Aureococcus anophagefferens]|nr:Beta-eliminating lyase [Aureococcus anophagefferens]
MASQKTIDLGAQHLPVGSAADQLRALADAAEATGYAFDTYGAGDGLNAFEAKVAAMLGKEAGLFVATGTMAQQSVLRAATWVHGLGSKPKAKKFARHAAVNLPDFDAAALGSFDRVIQLRDVVTAFYVPGAERNAAVVLELPQRMNGARPARRKRRPP